MLQADGAYKPILFGRETRCYPPVTETNELNM